MPAKKKTQTPGRAPRKFWRYAAQIAALWIAAFCAYSNSFDGALVFDNTAIIGDDPRIRAATADNLKLILDKEYWYPATSSGLYRPLAILSYLFNYTVLGEGPSPAGYHVINLALHEINIALVFGLGLLILGRSGAAFTAAAIWALHPLLTESVTNIVGRADLLAAFGVLAGLLCHARAASGGRPAWLAGLAAAQGIGIFSKESAAVLPGLMILYDLVFARGGWRSRIGNYAAAAIPLGVFFYLRSRVDTHMAITAAVNPIAAAGFAAGRMTAIKALGKLLWLFFWPARLSVDYSFNAIPLFTWNPLDWAALAALAAGAGLLALAIRSRKQRPVVFFIGFFLITLAPTSNLLFPIGAILAERFMYLPAAGLCGCAAVAFEWLKVRPMIKGGALAALCLAFGARTYARNFDWHDEIAIWSSATASYPECARAHYNLGHAWAERSDYPRAIREYEAALRILPDYPHVHFNLGAAIEKTAGGLAAAIAQYRAAVEEDPGFAEARYNLGDALARSGQIDAAIGQLQAAVRLKPELAEAHNDLGAIAAASGQPAQAMAEYQIALRARPDYAPAHQGLARIYLQENRLNDAIGELQAAVRSDPDSGEAHLNFGNALSQLPERFQDAVTEWGIAVRLRPDLGEAHYRLGMALLRISGREPEALSELETALRIRPDPQGERMVEELRRHLRR